MHEASSAPVKAAFARSCMSVGPGGSEVEHGPADVVPQRLIVEDELANLGGKLVSLPVALESPDRLAVTTGCSSTRGLDRVCGRTEIVCGDVCDACSLPRGMRRVPGSAAQVSGRAHGMAAGRAGLHHPHLPPHPGAGLLDRFTRSGVLGLCRLEEVEDVLRACCRPQRQEVVITVREGPTAADRHQARIPLLRKDHPDPFLC